MKTRAWALFFTVAVAATPARAQGTFQNLDFEAARVGLVTNALPQVAVSEALPGWSASDGTAQYATIAVYPAFPVIGGFPGSVALIASAAGSLDGNFSVVLGTFHAGPVPEHGTISQTGVVPAGVHSLLFKAALVSGSSLQVSLGGASLSSFPPSTQPDYTLYGADISAFAGQTANLTFMAVTRGVEIDDIQFSPQIVPEPGGAALFLLGLGMRTSVRRRGCSPARRASGAAAARCVSLPPGRQSLNSCAGNDDSCCL